MSDEKTFAEPTPVVLELMGHRRLGGFLSEVEVGGQVMLRIDVPSEPAVTQFYSASAVYAITPTTEEIARGLASRMRPSPVHRYELPAVMAPVSNDDGDLVEVDEWDRVDI